jgi:hypothetical protein
MAVQSQPPLGRTSALGQHDFRRRPITNGWQFLRVPALVVTADVLLPPHFRFRIQVRKDAIVAACAGMLRL